MAVVNTTYNFNQPNMNFGQAMLYGAFGSLTGGYGMGMGGSLFSMMGMGMGGYGCGFGGYGIGGYTDSYAGMQIGNAFAGIIMNTAAMALSGRGGNGGGTEKVTKTDADYKKEAEELVSDNDVKDAEKKLESAKTLATSIKNTKSRISTVSKSIEEYTTDLQTLESCDKTIKDYDDLEKKLLPNTPENEAHNKEINEQLTAKKAEYNKAKDDKAKILAKGDIKTELESLKKELESLKENLDKDVKEVNDLQIKGLRVITNAISDTTEITDAATKAVEDAKTDRNEKIEQKAKELKEADEAETKKQAERAKLEDDINKVDGNSVTRTKASKVKEKDPKDYDEDDVQGALAAFKNAKSDNDKKYWHGILHKMCQNNDLMNSINSNIAKIVKKYFSEDYKAE